MKCVAGMMLALAIVAGFAHATTVKPMSVEELTRAAVTVAEAHALESWTQWNPQHTIIFTYTRFALTKALKGTVPQQFVVKQPGGIVGDIGQRIPGVRQFQPGEDTVLFLRPSAAGDGSLVVVGLMQGNFRMYRALSGVVSVSNGVAGVHQLDGGGLRVYQGSAMPLDELESRVQEARSQ